MSSISDPLAEQIAFQLQAPGFDLAFLVFDNLICFSLFPQGQDAPSSAVIKLIQGVPSVFADRSLLALRQTVFTTAPFKESCRGMIKVAAKRGRDQLRAVDHGISLSMPVREFGQRQDIWSQPLSLPDSDRVRGRWRLGDIETRPTDQVLAELEDITVKGFESDQPRYERPWGIAALLLSASGQVLGTASNDNAVHKTRHAELLLIQDLYQRTQSRIPAHATLLVTHKPCQMCAGLIFEWSEDPSSLQIHFRHEVNGVRSRHTVFDRLRLGSSPKKL